MHFPQSKYLITCWLLILRAHSPNHKTYINHVTKKEKKDEGGNKIKKTILSFIFMQQKKHIALNANYCLIGL
jgi:hypothetical protein